jgi:hypothetical protein
MDLEEWLAGFKGVGDHGFVGLQGISTKEEAAEAFEKIDDNGGGIVLLDEWSYYLKNCEIAMGTAVGKLLALDQEGGVGKKEALFGSTMAKPSVTGPIVKAAPVAEPKKKQPQPLKRGGGAKSSKGMASSAPTKSAEELQSELRAWLQSKLRVKSDATENSVGLALGKTASPELLKIVSVFEPLAAETPEGEKLRAEGFVSADPNGSRPSFVKYALICAATFERFECFICVCLF